MKNEGSNVNEKLALENKDNQLLVSDIVQYVVSLARLNKDKRIGNPRLAEALQCVANALRPFRNHPARELANAIRDVQQSLRTTKRRPSARPTSTLPDELELVTLGDVEKMLGDGSYTKQQLIEVGSRRLGISRSRLGRLKKNDALEAIRAALAHEKSLDVISNEASKGGRIRPG